MKELGKYFYTIDIDTKKGKKELTELEQQTKKLGGKMKEAFSLSKAFDLVVKGIQMVTQFVVDGIKQVGKFNNSVADTLKSISIQTETAKLKTGSYFAALLANNNKNKVAVKDLTTAYQEYFNTMLELMGIVGTAKVDAEDRLKIEKELSTLSTKDLKSLLKKYTSEKDIMNLSIQRVLNERATSKLLDETDLKLTEMDKNKKLGLVTDEDINKYLTDRIKYLEKQGVAEKYLLDLKIKLKETEKEIQMNAKNYQAYLSGTGGKPVGTPGQAEYLDYLRKSQAPDTRPGQYKGTPLAIEPVAVSTKDKIAARAEYNTIRKSINESKKAVADYRKSQEIENKVATTQGYQDIQKIINEIGIKSGLIPNVKQMLESKVITDLEYSVNNLEAATDKYYTTLNDANSTSDQIILSEEEMNNAREKYNTELEKSNIQQEEQKAKLLTTVGVMESLIPSVLEMATLFGASSEEVDALNKNLETAVTWITEAASGDVAGLLLTTITYIVESWVAAFKDMSETYNWTPNITKMNNALAEQIKYLEEVERIQQSVIDKSSLYTDALSLDISEEDKQYLEDLQRINLLEGFQATFSKSESIANQLSTYISDPKYLTENSTEGETQRKIASAVRTATLARSNKIWATYPDVFDRLLSVSETGNQDDYLYLAKNYDKLVAYFGEETAFELMQQLGAIVKFQISTKTETTSGTVDEVIINNLEKQKQLLQDVINLKLKSYGIDIDNLYVQREIAKSLTQLGMSTSEKLAYYNDIGLKQSSNRTTSNIGSVNINVYEASGQTVESAVNSSILNTVIPDK